MERFHRTLRSEFDTHRVFPSLRAAQGELDEWVGHYNPARPHQSLDDATPAERFEVPLPRPAQGRLAERSSSPVSSGSLVG